ncbi:MAG TPA: hypothetical protein VGX02_07975 [Candidatus Eremiobacteraceae bacterium]|nr:hypothetical protein [Candidatus Eremiobacteraceae bacterium]
MFYFERLRVRNGLMWLAITLVVMLGIIFLVNLLSPHGHVNVSVGDSAASSPTSSPTTFVELLGAASLLVGGIMATIWGNALARENDGHLEVAWTKPVSRTTYATSVMLVDGVGLLLSVVLGFFALVLILIDVRAPITFSVAPSSLMDIARFLLFPLAWYALIVALSARLRGGGVVQGLIWPIALGLTGIAAAPLPPVWHTIAMIISLLNPMTYLQYHQNDFSLMTSTIMAPALLSDIALAVFVIGGWMLATTQWRRMEA